MIHSDPLHGPKLKLQRAKRHFKDFDEALLEFYALKPYEIFNDKDEKTGEDVIRVRVHKTIPCEFSVIIGDVIHNLRSALDQLICGLVRANNQVVSGANAFPIIKSEASFKNSIPHKLANISPKATRFINRLRPFDGGSKAFWMLNELDNMDKHNQIVPVAVGQAQAEMKLAIPGFFLSPDNHICIGGGPEGSVPFGHHLGVIVPEGAKVVDNITDNCEIYRGDLSVWSKFCEINVFAEVTFGKTKVTTNETIFDVLQNLIKLVERTIDIVERRIL